MYYVKAALCALLTLLVLSVLAGCPGPHKKGPAAQLEKGTAPPAAKPVETAPPVDPIARGKELFSTAAYSATGITCANCHAANTADLTGRIYIAHSALGMAPRGAWWISDDAQLKAMLGSSPTLADAALVCIAGPYMNYKLAVPPGDKDALAAYLNSIADPAAKDAKPFIVQTNYAMPPGGLTPNVENGKRVFESSCKYCHGAVLDLSTLKGAGGIWNPLQIMGKVRKAKGNWFNDHKGKIYGAAGEPASQRLARLFGMQPALAQGESGVEPPENITPAQGQGGEGVEDANPETLKFPKDGMPGFAPDLLTDQEVVDVAHYVMTL